MATVKNYKKEMSKFAKLAALIQQRIQKKSAVKRRARRVIRRAASRAKG